MNKHILLSLLVSFIFAATSVHANPAASPASSTPAPQAEKAKDPISGKIIQTMNAGGYTYIYVEQKNGKKIWVAVAETPVKVGSKVSLKPGMEMKNFESKALKRTFESIVFSDAVISGAIPEAKANKIDLQGKSVGSKGAIASKAGKISVQKATGAGATTVEGAFNNSAKLNNKKVVIAGKVVKVSSGIMGKNWIHIQDGTGSEKKKNHNLVCTSSQMAEVGEVVTVRGTLKKDKDFGAGYKYAVIIEEAKFSK